MRLIDVLLLAVLLVAGVGPIVVLPRRDVRVVRWSGVLATAGFGQWLALFLIPYDRHALRRIVFYVVATAVLASAYIVFRRRPDVSVHGNSEE